MHRHRIHIMQSMRFALTLTVLLLVVGVTLGCAASKRSEKVLILVSNVSDMGDPEKHEAKNNLWERRPVSVYAN